MGVELMAKALARTSRFRGLVCRRAARLDLMYSAVARLTTWEVPVGYVRDNLMPGERVVFETQLHWIVYGPAVAIALVSIGISFQS
jgi:hypothetical protein